MALITAITEVFQIRIEEGGDSFKTIGLNASEIREFFAQIGINAKEGKFYLIKCVEGSASQLNKLRFEFLLSHAGKELGTTSNYVRKMTEEYIINEIIAENDYYDPFLWLDKDPKGSYTVFKSVNDFTNKMLDDFLEAALFFVQQGLPQYEFPDTSLYKGKRKGKRNQLKHTEGVVFKIG